MLPYLLLILVAVGGAAFSQQIVHALAPAPAVSPAPGRTTLVEEPAEADALAPLRRWTPVDAFVAIALIAFAGLRLRVGTDYDSYVRLFSALEPGYLQRQVDGAPQEPGFTALQIVILGFSDNPRWLFLIASALSIAPVLWVIKRHTLNPTLALALYILLAHYVAPFNVVRQGVAVGLMVWASTYLNRRHWWMFGIITVAAWSIHSTALIVAVLYVLVMRWRPSARVVIAAVLAGAVASRVLLTWGPITELLIRINPRYDLYLDSAASQSQVAAAGVGTYLQVAVRVALLLFAVWVVHNYDLELTSQERHWFNLAVVGLVLLVLGTQSIVLARLDGYFGIFLVLLLPNLLVRARADIAYAIGLVVASSVFFAFYVTNYSDLVPYHFDWSFVLGRPV